MLTYQIYTMYINFTRTFGSNTYEALNIFKLKISTHSIIQYLISYEDITKNIFCIASLCLLQFTLRLPFVNRSLILLDFVFEILCYLFRSPQERHDLDVSRNDMISLIQVMTRFF